MAALRALAEEKSRAYRAGFVGRVLSVITLEGGDARRTLALSANFLRVELPGAFAANLMLDVQIEAVTNGALVAECVEEPALI